MRRALVVLLCLILPAAALPARAAESADELSIGVSQFPFTLNPLIDTMVAKTYVLALVRRPLTTYDPDWKLICLLCETLPSFENGLARKIPLPNGKQGVRLTFTIQKNAAWGDGEPVTSDDAIFTWQVGRNPQSGVAEGELYRRILDIKAQSAKTFTVDVDRLTYDYADFSDFEILPAHVERAAFADPTQYRFPDTTPTPPIPGFTTALTASPKSRRDLISCSSATRAGGAIRPSSAASWCGRSRTRRRSRPICWRAGSTWWRANWACRSTRPWPSRNAMAGPSPSSTSRA
jgi:ABC-type transport system substrate-binding protein